MVPFSLLIKKNMISIIVSTYKPENFRLFENNIKETIGDILYEIVKIDNPSLMGLCEAYNKGIALAKYPYLCFSHDDVKMITPEWGEYLVNVFKQNKDVGLVGIAGCRYKAWVPSGWFSPVSTFNSRANLAQCYPDGSKSNFIRIDQDNAKNGVICVDGCWFSTTASIAKETMFDEKTFRGYHFYDADFSFNISLRYRIIVDPGIFLEHYSVGATDINWLKDTFRFHYKWRRKLPSSLIKMSRTGRARNEYRVFRYLLQLTSQHNSCWGKTFRILYSPTYMKMVGLKRWCLSNRWLLGAYVRKIKRALS